MIRFVVLLALLLSSPPASAEPCRRALPMPAGTVAPCDGDLVPVRWAHELLIDRRMKRRFNRELEIQRARHQIELTAETDRVDAERAARLACERERAPPLPPPRPWWHHPAFTLTAGVIVGAAVASAIALTR